MARSTASMAIVFLAAFLMVSVIVREANAVITCGQVAGAAAPCIPYLQGTGTAPPPKCCNGVSNLNALATTTADRQAACTCLKRLAGSIPRINLGRAAGLPGACGVNVPYPIRTDTDCTKVH